MYHAYQWDREARVWRALGADQASEDKWDAAAILREWRRQYPLVTFGLGRDGEEPRRRGRIVYALTAVLWYALTASQGETQSPNLIGGSTMSWSHYYDTIVPCRQAPQETLRGGTLRLRCPDCGHERDCTRFEWLRLAAGRTPNLPSPGVSWQEGAMAAFKASHAMHRARALRAQGHIF